MKHKLIILIALLSIGLYTNAQEYRLAKSSGQLKLNITGVLVEGYEGKEIIFSGQKVISEDQDERAKGLVPITSSKYVDNTGLGINVTESEGIVNVNLVAKKPIGVLSIKVPNNMNVSINNNTNSNRVFFSSANFNENTNNASSNSSSAKGEDEIVVKNLKSELEVSVYWNKIRLENNSGPMNIKTVSGSVDAIFTGEVKGPISIISANNYVDVTLPATTKANIEMGSSYGKLYAGKEFKIDYEKLEPEKGVNRLVTSTNSLNRSISTSRNGSNDVVIVGYGSGSITSDSIKEKESGAKSTKMNGIQIQPKGKTPTPPTPPTTTTIVNGVEVKGSGVQVLSGSVYAPSGTHTTSEIHTTPMTIYTRGFTSGDRIKGKLNGGGVDLIFKSTNKNVYLRQP